MISKRILLRNIFHHLSLFISRLWQIHVFGEGNMRTTAVFFIKYLRQLGFEADNDMFAEHSWYFRNALVRANYSNIKKGIYETTDFLEMFNPIKQETDPINDPINKMGLSKREKKVLELLRRTTVDTFKPLEFDGFRGDSK